ncbi:MAG: rRNA adenine dimethyltransferase family protein, partial [Candidatus Magasanikbacteria bacterium]
ELSLQFLSIERLSQKKKLKAAILNEDILEIFPKVVNCLDLSHKKYKLTGNIPYYITGYLLRVLSQIKNKPETISITMQKDVANRVVCTPPDMNILSASLQFWGNPKIIKKVPRSSFSPPPEVESCIIKIKTKRQCPKKMQTKYYSTVRAVFRHPRKTILNNLALASEVRQEKRGLKKVLSNIGIEKKDRPQNLSVTKIIKMSKRVKFQREKNS